LKLSQNPARPRKNFFGLPFHAKNGLWLAQLAGHPVGAAQHAQTWFPRTSPQGGVLVWAVSGAAVVRHFLIFGTHFVFASCIWRARQMRQRSWAKTILPPPTPARWDGGFNSGRGKIPSQFFATINMLYAAYLKQKTWVCLVCRSCRATVYFLKDRFIFLPMPLHAFRNFSNDSFVLFFRIDALDSFD
jgi:hypothetical protein